MQSLSQLTDSQADLSGSQFAQIAFLKIASESLTRLPATQLYDSWLEQARGQL